MNYWVAQILKLLLPSWPLSSPFAFIRTNLDDSESYLSEKKLLNVAAFGCKQQLQCFFRSRIDDVAHS